MASWSRRGRRCERTKVHPGPVSMDSPPWLDAVWNRACHLLSSAGFGDSQADTEDSVGTQLSLVGGAIEAVEKLIDLGLVLDIDGLLDQRRADGGVDVLDSLANALAAPLGLVAVSELTGFVLAYERGQYSRRYEMMGELGRYEPVEAPDGTMARWRPVSVTTSTSTVGLPRESYTERAWTLVMAILPTFVAARL